MIGLLRLAKTLKQWLKIAENRRAGKVRAHWVMLLIVCGSKASGWEYSDCCAPRAYAPSTNCYFAIRKSLRLRWRR